MRSSRAGRTIQWYAHQPCFLGKIDRLRRETIFIIRQANSHSVEWAYPSSVVNDLCQALVITSQKSYRDSGIRPTKLVRTSLHAAFKGAKHPISALGEMSCVGWRGGGDKAQSITLFGCHSNGFGKNSVPSGHQGLG